MIEYYDLLNEEEQDDMRDLIQLLLRQTFLLERKYDRRAGRMVPVREYTDLVLRVALAEVLSRTALGTTGIWIS